MRTRTTEAGRRRLSAILVLAIGLMLAVFSQQVSAAQGGDGTTDMQAKAQAPADQRADAGWDKLASECDALYRAAAKGSRQSAFLHVLRIERLLRQLAEKETEAGGSAEPVKALQSEAAAVRSALDRGRPLTEWQDDAASLKLAVNAHRDGSMALWHSYEKLLHEDAAYVAQAWRGPSPDNAKSALAALRLMQSRVSRMEAAALLEAGPQQIAQLNERLRYTAGLLASAGTGNGASLAEEAIGGLDAAVTALFDADPHAASSRALAALFPPPGEPSWQWPAALWTIIIAALLYAGWRKYRFDRGASLPPGSNSGGR